MGLIVQKYGGTSVADIERIRRVADKVIATYEQGHNVVVVVSAMSGETNRLIRLMREMSANPTPREYAVAVSTGEQVCMALLASCLVSRGYQAKSYTGLQAKILTDNFARNAKILDINPKRLQKDIENRTIAIVAGFQGVSMEGDITTLGRGGSDTTAVALAAKLEADECHIYTDVDGVYTADPRVVPDARRLDAITLEEMLEMASLGAKVLQKRSVQFAGRYKVPLRVFSSFADGPGTLITYEEVNMEDAVVTGIAFNIDEAKLTIQGVPDEPGIASKILTPIGKANVDIDMIIQNIGADGSTDFTFTVHRDDYERATEVLEQIKREIGATGVKGDPQIAKISLVGVGMRSHSGVASKMFTVLGEEGINIQLIATSEIKISVVVEEQLMEQGVRALHAAFGLSGQAKQEHDPIKTS